ncbi:efflux RND transporter periplasmic adaptor subunit [Terrimonas sp. NA20]|uniref:Efflux RND transporter periplasmic adaptor subunit n=1 Tax=Terrimonas ginsenosidimutans TaxID=2908004 RepID=A0ABS9KUZ4_9BACT|nr:efflux RND transporter periplasmic adaptor subunit [Terrimonas ginsenosidimutans]MCG2616156.1 efflux RND transporter periplasmic adaptor subunit [Terrimonas ginsenosidimutans]
MKNAATILIFTLLAWKLQSCGSADEKSPAAQTEEKGHNDEYGNGNTATLTAEQIKSIGIEIGGIEEKQLTASIRANGALRVPNQNKASVNSLYSGIIRSLLIQPGNIVKKGQVIATVANPDFIQSQEEYLSINPRITLAEQEYSRQKELNAGNAGALKNLQSAESSLNALRTRKSALAQQILLMGINPSSLENGQLISVLSLRAPISGIVSNVSVKIGSYIDLNTPVADIVDNSQLHLDLFVYEKDLPRLKDNQSIHFTLTNNPGKEYDAEIYSLGSSFEDESKAVSVHATVKGDKTGLIDGMNITALISLDKITTPAVPNDAIVTHQGQDYIFLVKEPQDHKETHEETGNSTTFEKIPVAKGTSEVGYTQITVLKQIPANARIVTKGAFFVLARITNSGEGEHGH